MYPPNLKAFWLGIGSIGGVINEAILLAKIATHPPFVISDPHIAIRVFAKTQGFVKMQPVADGMIRHGTYMLIFRVINQKPRSVGPNPKLAIRILMK